MYYYKTLYNHTIYTICEKPDLFKDVLTFWLEYCKNPLTNLINDTNNVI